MSAQGVSVKRPDNCVDFSKYKQWTGRIFFVSVGTNKIKDCVFNVGQKTRCLGSDHWGLTKQIPTVGTHHFTICQVFLLKSILGGVMFGCCTATWRLYSGTGNTCYQSFYNCEEQVPFFIVICILSETLAKRYITFMQHIWSWSGNLSKIKILFWQEGSEHSRAVSTHTLQKLWCFGAGAAGAELFCSKKQSFGWLQHKFVVCLGWM